MPTEIISIKSNTDLTRDGRFPDAIMSGTNGRATLVLKSGDAVPFQLSRGLVMPIYVRKVLSKGRTARKMIALFEDRTT